MKKERTLSKILADQKTSLKKAKKHGAHKKVIDGWEEAVKKAQDRVNALQIEVDELHKYIDEYMKDKKKIATPF